MLAVGSGRDKMSPFLATSDVSLALSGAPGCPAEGVLTKGARRLGKLQAPRNAVPLVVFASFHAAAN